MPSQDLGTWLILIQINTIGHTCCHIAEISVHTVRWVGTVACLPLEFLTVSAFYWLCWQIWISCSQRSYTMSTISKVRSKVQSFTYHAEQVQITGHRLHQDSVILEPHDVFTNHTACTSISSCGPHSKSGICGGKCHFSHHFTGEKIGSKTLAAHSRSQR